MSQEVPVTAGPAEARAIPPATWWWGVGITLATIAVYAQVWGQPFCSYDEPRFLVKNSMLNRGLTWEGVCWAFTTFYDFNYNPIPWLTHMLDVSLFGMDMLHAGPQKLMSLGYHVLATWALLFLLVKTTGSVWRSAAVSALFALHPLHVEDVTFVIVRKDILACAFGFLTMLAYFHYARRPGWLRYFWVVLFTAMSLLSKSVSMTLPFVLMLMDIWPLGCWRLSASSSADQRAGDCTPRPLKRLVLEKLPLLAMSAGVGVLAMASRPLADASTKPAVFLERVANASVGYVLYLGKMLWPADLCYFYGLHPAPAWQVAGSLLLLLVITGIALASFKRSPWVLFGWLFFLGTMVPVIGFVQYGEQSIADRYTYFPLTGLFIAIVYSLPESWATADRRWALAAGGAALAAALLFATHRQVGFWRDDTTLFFHALAVDPDNKTNLINLSGQLILEGRVDEARVFTTRLIKEYPLYVRGYAAHGKVLELKGMPAEAESVYRHGIEMNPGNAKCRSQLAALLLAQRRPDEAIAEYESAAALEPKNLDPQRELAGALIQLDRAERAAEILRRVLTADPNDVKSLTNLGVCFDRLGRPRDAVASLERAVAIRPGFVDARENLGAIYAQLGRLDDATRQYEWMVQQRNQKPEWLAMANHRLGLLRSQAGRLSEAVECLRTAARLTPMDADVHNDLGVALAQQRDLAGAASEFAAALKADPNHAGAKANLERASKMLNPPAATSPAPAH